MPEGACFRKVDGPSPGYDFETRVLAYGDEGAGPTWLMCHAHLHYQVLEINPRERNFVDAWPRTPAGRDFAERTGWRLEGGVWVQPDDLELWTEQRAPLVTLSGDATDACDWWVTGRPQFSQETAPLRYGWAEEWLRPPP